MVSTSLKPKSEVLQDTISLIGSRVTTENYERAWNAFPFARYMFNSIFVGLATTALTVFTSAMAAYAFARLKFKEEIRCFCISVNINGADSGNYHTIIHDITYIGMA